MSNRFTHTVEDSLFTWSRVTQEWQTVFTLVRVTGFQWFWCRSFALREHLTQTWRQTNGNFRKNLSFVPSPLSYLTHFNLLANLVVWSDDAAGASISRVLCLGTTGRSGAESTFCLWCVVSPRGRSPGFSRHPSLFAGWARLGFQLPLAATHIGPGSFSATVSLCPTDIITYPAVKLYHRKANKWCICFTKVR